MEIIKENIGPSGHAAMPNKSFQPTPTFRRTQALRLQSVGVAELIHSAGEKMRSILMTVVIFCCLVSTATATSQIPEELLYNGVTYDMYSTPLESFFSPANPKPKVFDEYPSSTACWRGYVGTWKIDEGYLYLVSLKQGHPYTDLISLDKINPKWSSPVKAVWFSGTIRIGKGKVLMGGMGFSEKREIEIFIEIKKGKLVSIHNS